jgi:hypothetical protein
MSKALLANLPSPKTPKDSALWNDSPAYHHTIATLTFYLTNRQQIY